MRSGPVRLLAAVLLLGACSPQTAAPAPTPASPVGVSSPGGSSPSGRVADPDLVTMQGLRGIEIGASKQDLVAAGKVSEEGPCGPVFPDIPNASPVFDGDRLVLVWAHAPLRTPERISEGSTLEQARQAYPSAVELPRPAGATEYPGLLVPGDADLALLLLHDGAAVQKVIVGFESAARLLFDTGFGSC